MCYNLKVLKHEGEGEGEETGSMGLLGSPKWTDNGSWRVSELKSTPESLFSFSFSCVPHHESNESSTEDNP